MKNFRFVLEIVRSCFCFPGAHGSRGLPMLLIKSQMIGDNLRSFELIVLNSHHACNFYLFNRNMKTDAIICTFSLWDVRMLQFYSKTFFCSVKYNVVNDRDAYLVT